MKLLQAQIATIQGWYDDDVFTDQMVGWKYDKRTGEIEFDRERFDEWMQKFHGDLADEMRGRYQDELRDKKNKEEVQAAFAVLIGTMLLFVILTMLDVANQRV